MATTEGTSVPRRGSASARFLGKDSTGIAGIPHGCVAQSAFGLVAHSRITALRESKRRGSGKTGSVGFLRGVPGPLLFGFRTSPLVHRNAQRWPRVLCAPTPFLPQRSQHEPSGCHRENRPRQGRQGNQVERRGRQGRPQQGMGHCRVSGPDDADGRPGEDRRRPVRPVGSRPEMAAGRAVQGFAADGGADRSAHLPLLRARQRLRHHASRSSFTKSSATAS